MAQRRAETSREAGNKRWPTNPKYQNARPVVDSGATVRKYLEGIEERHRDFRLSKDEVFRRIKLSTFVSLVIEVWRSELQVADYSGDCNESPSALPAEVENASQGRRDGVADSRSTLHGLISGIGEMDLGHTGTGSTTTVMQYARPYLLLDVRDADDFVQWHLVAAINYPHTMLSRVMNYETKELLAYKNKPGFIIVAYDEDETLSQKVATTLVQRGYDNVYLLSGGLNLAWRRYADALAVGRPSKNHPVVTEPRTPRRPSPSAIRTQDFFTLADLDRLEQGLTMEPLTSTSGGRSAPSTQRTKSDIGGADVSSRPKNGQRSSAQIRPWK